MTSLQIALAAPAPAIPAAAGVRSIIKAARVAMPAPDLAPAPVRAFVATVCTAEVTHAAADFWSIVHRIKAAGSFDAYADPDCHTAFRLPHEAHAGAALNWLQHLQSHDGDRRGPWARWDGLSIEGKREWLARRRYLLRGLLRAANAYRNARKAG